MEEERRESTEGFWDLDKDCMISSGESEFGRQRERFGDENKGSQSSSRASESMSNSGEGGQVSFNYKNCIWDWIVRPLPALWPRNVNG